MVPAERADLLAERIAWAAEHRRELATMGIEARRRAELFTWARFRRGVAAAVAEFMAAETAQQKGVSNAFSCPSDRCSAGRDRRHGDCP